ncbi:toll-like receptor 13, partial [Lates japonicus]
MLNSSGSWTEEPVFEETEVGANPVQVEVGEFDEAIEVVEDVVAESKSIRTRTRTRTSWGHKPLRRYHSTTIYFECTAEACISDNTWSEQEMIRAEEEEEVFVRGDCSQFSSACSVMSLAALQINSVLPAQSNSSEWTWQFLSCIITAAMGSWFLFLLQSFLLFLLSVLLHSNPSLAYALKNCT